MEVIWNQVTWNAEGQDEEFNFKGKQSVLEGL